ALGSRSGPFLVHALPQTAGPLRKDASILSRAHHARRCHHQLPAGAREDKYYLRINSKRPLTNTLKIQTGQLQRANTRLRGYCDLKFFNRIGGAAARRGSQKVLTRNIVKTMVTIGQQGVLSRGAKCLWA